MGYEMLFGSNLRCGALTKWIFADGLLDSRLPVSLLSVHDGHFESDAVSFILFCRSNPTFSERP
jgi:hypothetical protein